MNIALYGPGPCPSSQKQLLRDADSTEGTEHGGVLQVDALKVSLDALKVSSYAKNTHTHSLGPDVKMRIINSGIRKSVREYPFTSIL